MCFGLFKAPKMPTPLPQPVTKPLPKPEEIKSPEPLKDEKEGEEKVKRATSNRERMGLMGKSPSSAFTAPIPGTNTRSGGGINV